MKSSRFPIIAGCVLLFAVGCSYEELFNDLVPAEEAEMAKTILADLRNGQVEYVNSLLSDELKSETSRETLEKAASFFHPGELLSAELIGSQVNVTNQQWTGNFTYEYHFESGWNLANAALRKTGDSY